MHAPLRLGLSPSDAQPGEPGGTHAPRSDDRALLDAVRGGDTDAFGVLYSRHLAAVRRLSRRVARDRDEADDIVSDVFANTLRAIRRGRGPVDDAQAYLLRSVRHTAGKLRSRKDTGRSEPVPIDRLDRPVSTDVHLRSDIEIALLHLPDRHRDVLWATCVEGRPAGELAAADGVAASCVTSLTLRARRALGRSYLLQRTARPEPTTKCRRIRTSMPGCLRDEVTTATATTIYDHIDGCGACREVYEEMSHLDRDMCSVTLIGLVVPAVRGWRRFGTPIVATVAKPLASAVIVGAVVTGASAIEPPARDVDPTEQDESATDWQSTTRPWLMANPVDGAPTTDGQANHRLVRADGAIDPAGPTATASGDEPTHDDDDRPRDPPSRPATDPSPVPPIPPATLPSEAPPTDPATAVGPDVVASTTIDGMVAQLGSTANTIVAETTAVVGQALDAVVDGAAQVAETVEDTVGEVAAQVVTITETGSEFVDHVATVAQDDLVEDVVDDVVDDVVEDVVDDVVDEVLGRLSWLPAPPDGSPAETR